MWQWSLNWNRIRDDIVVGSCPMTTDDIDKIRTKTKVTALLSLQTDLCREHFGIDYPLHVVHGQAAGLTMLNVPMLDFNTDDQRRVLPDAVHGLNILLASGYRVYVHCTAGMNRSPLTVLGYLTFVDGLAPEPAFKRIQKRRREAAPDWEAYNGCRSDLLERSQEEVIARSRDLHKKNKKAHPDHNWFQAERAVLSDLFRSQMPQALVMNG